MGDRGALLDLDDEVGPATSMRTAGGIQWSALDRPGRGSWVHSAVDTLGTLLALVVTAADEQDRAQVEHLAGHIGRPTLLGLCHPDAQTQGGRAGPSSVCP